MPVVKSIHKLMLEQREDLESVEECNGINNIISGITFDILRDSPGLVADVANGTVSRNVLETAIIKDLDKKKYHFGILREELIQKVFDFMFGYGLLQKYIDDEDITDIDGTRYNEFAIKKYGRRFSVPVNFENERTFDTYCKLIAVRNGGILNENDSHCRITDESRRLRINVSIFPRNINGPAISIRKHRKKSYNLDDLAALGMYGNSVCNYLKHLAASEASVLFCGKGAAGKTTLMRAFINVMPLMDRVLIAESDAEIYPDKPYCIEQRIKKANEGGRPVSLQDLVRDGLTMSLDTYVVGEIVGDEAWEFVKAAYTGHRGVATTHSESAADAFGRLLTLSKGAKVGESEKTIKQMLAKSINVIVYLERFRITEILAVDGYDEINDTFMFSSVPGIKKEFGSEVAEVVDFNYPLCSGNSGS